MDGCASEILEDEDQIEVLQTVLNTFEMSDFDFVERDDEEGRFGEEDESIGRWLEKNIGTEWYTLETEFSERNIDIDSVVRLFNMMTTSKLVSFYKTEPESRENVQLRQSCQRML